MSKGMSDTNVIIDFSTLKKMQWCS